jgi:DNA-binding GntR family transcriptional regulator
MTVPAPSEPFVAARPRSPMTAGDFWGELDGDVLRCLAATRERLSAAEIGDRIGVSEDGVRSILTMLVQEGKVRICSVAYVTPASDRPPVA